MLLIEELSGPGFRLTRRSTRLWLTGEGLLADVYGITQVVIAVWRVNRLKPYEHS